jgi:integrase/recombinase XerD
METYEKLLEKFLDNIKTKGLSERTIKIFRSSVGHFLKYLEENEISEITEVTKTIISDYSLSLLTYKAKSRGTPDEPKAYKAASRVSLLTAVKRFFKFLRHENILLFDPSVGVTLPKVPKYLSRDIPTLQEVDKILSSIDKSIKWGLRDYAIIETMYSTGLRSSEIVKLKLEDIDFERKFLTVQKGKNGKPRTVPLSKPAVSALTEYIENCRPRFGTQFLIKNQPDNGILFLSHRGGGLLTVTSINTIVQVYAKKAGIKKHLIPHSFRYACATHMMKNGADIRFIQEMLGHETLQATQGYTRVVKGDLKRVIKEFHPRETDYQRDAVPRNAFQEKDNAKS